MNMIFTGKVSGEKTALTAGGRHTVKAVPGEQYGLVDEATGLVPAGVEADRSGDDLILRNKEEDTEVRIEGFWEECQPGEMQCSAVFNVAGENGQVSEAVLTQDGPVLEAITAGESGTLAEGINPGIIWGGIAFGAGLAAIALAAGGGGGGGSHHRSASAQENTRPSVQGSDKGEPGSNGKPDDVGFQNKPAVTDKDGNGKADTSDQAVADAEAAVKAAEDKKAEADDAAKNADKDGNNLITPEEAKAVEDANAALEAAKQAAQEAVNKVPEGDKGNLQDRVNALTPAQVPAVTDKDGNGIPDGFENLSESTAPIYTGNINHSDGNALTKLATLFTFTGQTSYNVPYDQLSGSHKAIVDANPGGFDARVSGAENTGNKNGLMTFNLHGDEDKVISTTKSLGNIAVGGADYILDLTMSTQNGDDVFVIGRDAGFTNTSGDGHSLTVSTNGGNDIFIIGASNTDHKVIYGDDGILRLEDSSYNLKDGEFLFSALNYTSSASDGGTIHNALINMGDGNDTFIALGQKGNAETLRHSDINMGAGNDTLILYGDITGPGNMAKGGAGMDTLMHNWGKLSSGDISGFEKLNLGSHSEFNLTGDYLSGLEGVTLKITGESNTKVILESNASVNTGTWSQGADRMEDGVNYHVYNNSNYPAAQVLIEDDIHNVTIK